MRVSLTAADLTPERPARMYPSGAPTLVCLASPPSRGRYRLLAGPAPGADPVKARCIKDPEAVAALDAIAGSVEPLDRAGKMRLAEALSPHVRAPQLAALLDHRDPAEVWRWGALGRAHPKLRDAILAGQLRMAHARHLLSMAHEAQADWTTRALRGRWSVRKLTAAIRQEHGAAAGVPSSADIRSLETTLGDRLGAPVRLVWPDDPTAQRRLEIDWFDVESLKGILGQLAAGPEQLDEPLQMLRRRLVIDVQNSGELAALTDHLLSG